jgi:hypothetical protein
MTGTTLAALQNKTVFFAVVQRQIDQMIREKKALRTGTESA